MKIKIIWTVIYSLAIATLGFSLLTEKLNAVIYGILSSSI